MKHPQIVLDDWQKEALEHRGDLILCTGRQIGKTYILAQKAKKRMLERPNTKIIIVSLTEDQAKLIINMILSSFEQTHKNLIMKGVGMVTQNKITIKNGSVALARPVGNTGDAIRGFTGDILIIDEGSRFPELAFTSGEPTLLSTGGEVWMASTPHGKKGYFWEQYNAVKKQDETEQENEMGWKVIHVNGEKAIHERPISPSWTQDKKDKAIKRLKNLKLRWSSLRYGQEILAEFLDDLQRFFSDELIEKVCILKRPEKITPGKYYLGNDLARMGGDSFTAEIIEDTGTIYKQVENYYEKNLLTTTNENLILEFAKLWNVRKVGIDAGAGTLGVSILDHLLQTPIKHKIVALNNRSIYLDSDLKTSQRLAKEDYYDNLRAMLENGELLLLDDISVKQSLRSILIELKEDQYGMTKIKIWGNESHIVEGIHRAAFLAKKEKSLNLWVY